MFGLKKKQNQQIEDIVQSSEESIDKVVSKEKKYIVCQECSGSCFADTCKQYGGTCDLCFDKKCMCR